MKTMKKAIVVTGGAGGIGLACARKYKEELVVITDYSQKIVDETVEMLKSEGLDVIGFASDISSKEDVAKLTKFVADHGEFKALIHTAGVSGTVKDTKKVFTIDLIGTDILLDAFYEIANPDSVAVLMSSMMAHVVPSNEAYDDALKNPQADGSYAKVEAATQGDSDIMYNFAKKGVLLLLEKNVDKWGGKRARVVSISPGVIETPMALKAAAEHPEKMEMIRQATPLKRNGQPDDIADVAYFLTSKAASFITGTDILVDGGVLHNLKKMG
ncbi:MAG: SDR family oxidoreductase [Crocinitomicaceae bacterium]|nr:SDR family oxidoreductase [Crocinitomicaceae bacterium]